MLVGWKHACECSKCKKIFFFENFDEAKYKEKNELSLCCNMEYKYIGLRPKYESILIDELPYEDNETNFSVEKTITYTDKMGTVESFIPVPIENDSLDDSENDFLNDFENDIKVFIDTSKRMTNKYMVEIVRAILEEYSEDFSINESVEESVMEKHRLITKKKLEIIKDDYPGFFEHALDYIPKFLKLRYSLPIN